MNNNSNNQNGIKKYPGTTVSLISGGIAGLISAAALQPLDLLKTRLQQQQINTKTHLSPTITSELKKLKQFKQLWRGVLPSTLRTSVGAGLYFTILSTSRNYVSKLKTNQTSYNPTVSSSILPKLSPFENLSLGFICRATVGYITMPITVIKTRYESNFYNYRSLHDATTGIYHEGNKSIKIFFKGSIATLARDSPYAGIYVLFYESCKHDLLPQILSLTNFPLYPGFINSTSALLAASIATAITAPFDAIKTRLQISSNHSSIIQATNQLISEPGGIKNLFKGLSLRLGRKGASAAISWCVYEELLKSNLADQIFTKNLERL
jgi:solute carrier family 25 protein 38